MKKWAEDLSRHCSREQVRMAVRPTKSRPRSPVSRERQSKTAARYRPHLSERPSPVNQRAASVGEDGREGRPRPPAGLRTGAAATENSEKVSRTLSISNFCGQIVVQRSCRLGFERHPRPASGGGSPPHRLPAGTRGPWLVCFGRDRLPFAHRGCTGSTVRSAPSPVACAANIVDVSLFHF